MLDRNSYIFMDQRSSINNTPLQHVKEKCSSCQLHDIYTMSKVTPVSSAAGEMGTISPPPLSRLTILAIELVGRQVSGWRVFTTACELERFLKIQSRPIVVLPYSWIWLLSAGYRDARVVPSGVSPRHSFRLDSIQLNLVNLVTWLESSSSSRFRRSLYVLYFLNPNPTES